MIDKTTYTNFGKYEKKNREYAHCFSLRFGIEQLLLLITL